MPFVTGGDFNATPISSVLSAFYNENIFAGKDEEGVSPSTWRVPEDFDRERQLHYVKLNEIFQKKIEQGKMSPLIGNMKSAYQFY